MTEVFKDIEILLPLEILHEDFSGDPDGQLVFWKIKLSSEPTSEWVEAFDNAMKAVVVVGKRPAKIAGEYMTFTSRADDLNERVRNYKPILESTNVKYRELQFEKVNELATNARNKSKIDAGKIRKDEEIEEAKKNLKI